MRIPLALGGIALAAVGYGLKEYCKNEKCFESENKKHTQEEYDLDVELEEFDALLSTADEVGEVLEIISDAFHEGLDKIEDLLVWDQSSSTPEEEERRTRAHKFLLEKSLEEIIKKSGSLKV